MLSLEKALEEWRMPKDTPSWEIVVNFCEDFSVKQELTLRLKYCGPTLSDADRRIIEHRLQGKLSCVGHFWNKSWYICIPDASSQLVQLLRESLQAVKAKCDLALAATSVGCGRASQ